MPNADRVMGSGDKADQTDVRDVRISTTSFVGHVLFLPHPGTRNLALPRDGTPSGCARTRWFVGQETCNSCLADEVRNKRGARAEHVECIGLIHLRRPLRQQRVANTLLVARITVKVTETSLQRPMQTN